MSRTEAPAGTRTAGESATSLMAGAGAVLTATVFWTVGTVVVKLIDASPLAIVFWRFVLATPLACLLLLWHGRRASMQALRRGWIGGVLFAVHVLVYFAALQNTTVAVVTFLAALQPLLVMALARPILGEAVARSTLGWGLLAIGGVALVVAGADTSRDASWFGNALAILNVLLWTAYFVVSKRIRVHIAANGYQGTILVIAAVAVLPFAPAAFGPSGGVPSSDWGWLVFIATIPSLGHLLLNWAHRHVPASISSLIILALPVFAAVGAALFLGEPFGPLEATGGGIVLVATGVVVYRNRGAESYSAEESL